MSWNITGDVGSGMVSSEKLCQRCQILNFSTQSTSYPIFRPDTARVLFETLYSDGIKCLDTCLKYNRAQAPIFSDQATFDELVSWAINTTVNPVTKAYFKDVVSATFWIGIT